MKKRHSACSYRLAAALAVQMTNVESELVLRDRLLASLMWWASGADTVNLDDLKDFATPTLVQSLKTNVNAREIQIFDAVSNFVKSWRHGWRD